MSYRIADKVNGTIGGLFATEAEARAFIEDDGYVRRILSAPENERSKVAMECASERMRADYTVVLSAE